MKEVKGDIWDYHRQGHWIVIPTNLTLDSKGHAVMGAGLALEAKKRFKKLPEQLGSFIEDFYCENEIDDLPYFNGEIRIICLPTKKDWWGKSDIGLIERTLKSLYYVITNSIVEKTGLNLVGWSGIIKEIYLPRLGCGLGGLDWGEVKLAIEPLLDDRFTIVEWEV